MKICVHKNKGDDTIGVYENNDNPCVDENKVHDTNRLDENNVNPCFAETKVTKDSVNTCLNFFSIQEFGMV